MRGHSPWGGRREAVCCEWGSSHGLSFSEPKAEAAGPRLGVSVSSVSDFSKTMIRFRSGKLSPEMFKLAISNDDESQHLTEPIL